MQTSLGPLANYDGPSHAEHARLVEPENYVGIESGMVFLGMAALEDPPRPEVRDAIEECTLAGIRVSSCCSSRASDKTLRLWPQPAQEVSCDLLGVSRPS